MGTPKRSRRDVAVVGARAGGGALALLLSRLGHDVVVLDRALLPSDTLSTHSIARSGVVQLHRWGLLDEVLASGAPAIRQVTFHTPAGSATHTIKDRAGVDLLVAPRRHALDTIVARAAADAGATLRLGVTVTDVRRDAMGGVTGLSARGHGISDAYRDAELLATALDAGLRGDRPFGAALGDYRRQADQARREIFGIACALAAFRPVARFVELQRQLSAAIDVEATALAARPGPQPRRLAVA